MAQYVSVSLRNGQIAQHVFYATDDVAGATCLPDTPLSAGEQTGPILLIADENGHGRMTYGYRGGIPTSSTDLNDGDVIDA